MKYLKDKQKERHYILEKVQLSIKASEDKEVNLKEFMYLKIQMKLQQSNNTVQECEIIQNQNINEQAQREIIKKE
ncbi:unnamed protein product [Paramecium pentaurelia]|uniref:Uncharacterized protein n=1 Tax=Paramecium pentaurelia TaxID=43138 RepID=A0A8S1T2I4_9CILI|nr:unnamed protein product [Paramecium pentaurelia]